MMIITEKSEVIPPYQYRGRKGHITIEPGLENDMFFRLSRMGRWSTDIIFSKTPTCYDRIYRTAISWEFQQWGVPEKLIIKMMTYLQQMILYL